MGNTALSLEQINNHEPDNLEVNPRILVVDDEEPVRRLLARLLKVHEFDCTLASNASEARKKLFEAQFDLILCDIKMPGETGLDFIKYVKEQHHEIAVVMLTGIDDPELADEFLDIGAYGYMVKPFNPSELRINISNALRRRDLEIQNRLYHENLEQIVARKTRELNELFKKIKQAMNGMIQAMGLAVESRDPYTAGHQRRVSHLAESIAVEMGLPDETVEGIGMAGIVHDLGKISVPAEILTRPSILTDNEFEIIKNHTLVGYEILKDIQFPWPVPSMVVQHHEKMDGSGYPHGLSGDEILMESRILCVADVVEAMASHRPYRPALGIQTALEEISKNKGRLYDSEAVEACMRLFQDKSYRLPE